jgi:hypothetical protein
LESYICAQVFGHDAGANDGEEQKECANELCCEPTTQIVLHSMSLPSLDKQKAMK